jgi:hypothetical protein
MAGIAIGWARSRGFTRVLHGGWSPLEHREHASAQRASGCLCDLRLQIFHDNVLSRAVGLSRLRPGK